MNAAWQPYVIVESGPLYRMWYNGGSGQGAGGVGYAWSTNGIDWTKYSDNPVVSPGPLSWDADNTEEPCVMSDGADGFRMWYAGVPLNLTTLQVGYATAINETTWVKADSINPVFSPMPGTWEPTWLRTPRVLWDTAGYQMLYSAGPPYNTNARGIGYATSVDGISWARAAGNPVLQSTQGTWDEGGIWVGDVMFDGGAYHMWYVAGYLTALRTGYATATVTTVQEVAGDLPSAFLLEQNYPNPFNPSTTIQFALPRSESVTLTVFNLLGERMTTLFSGRLSAGTHRVQWDVQGSPAGVYFYKLQAGTFTTTKKLVLLR
jgi:hypothetical protein